MIANKLNTRQVINCIIFCGLIFPYFFTWGADVESFERSPESEARMLAEANRGMLTFQKKEYNKKFPLFELIRSGNLVEIEKLVEINPELAARSDGDTYPIILATALGKLDILKYLISKKVDVNASINGTNPLFCALYDDSTSLSKSLVELLLQAGANPNVIDENGVSPLMVASIGGNSQMALLLASNADVNQQGFKRKSALHIAVEYHNPKGVKMLLEHGADPSLVDENGRKPWQINDDEKIREIFQNAVNKDFEFRMATQAGVKYLLITFIFIFGAVSMLLLNKSKVTKEAP